MKCFGAFIAISIILSAVACTAPGGAAEPVADQPTAVVASIAAADMTAELSLDALGDATYQGVLEEPTTLTDGRFEGQPFVEGGAVRPIVTLLPEPVSYGDLDGDGQSDTAVLLAANTGGSGTFVHLAAVALRDGRPVNLATTLLGDRVQVKSLSIDNGQIEVTLLTQGPDDPQCCPSQEVTRTFRLSGDQLIEEGSG